MPVAVSHPFVYAVPSELLNIEPGFFVQVPFRGGLVIGVVWDVDVCTKNDALQCLKGKKKIKEVYSILSGIPRLGQGMMRFIQRVATYNMAPLGMVLRMVLGMSKAQLVKLAADHKKIYGSFLEHSDVYDSETDSVNSSIPNNIGGIRCYEDNDPVAPARALFTHIPELSHEQQNIAVSISANLGAYHTSVIHGITGSGKTEIYLWLAQEVLKTGGQVLVLVPEIVLTTQLLQRFKRYIPKKYMLQWHSNITPAMRRKVWLSVSHEYSGGYFVVGARSALFLPFRNLKMIVVDEEHDTSFKQENGVIYHARDMAVMRAKTDNIAVVFASATPSMETLHNAYAGRYDYYKLCTRYNAAVLPKVELLDMSDSASDTNRCRSIHAAARKAIIETVQNGKQALIFVNRRGYAPYIFCTNCRNSASCPNCSAQLIYHKYRSVMQCHYCGYSLQYTTKCTVCRKDDAVVLFGVGAERIAEEIKELLPSARVAILTSDTINTLSKAYDVLDKIIDHEVDVIVGTQMIAKGLHFPNLKLVVVIDADPSVLGCDIRALERTYQILHQVIGRSGREGEQGMVLIQTTDHKNGLFQHIVNGDMEKFAMEELAQRKEALVPPFRRFVLLRCSSLNERVLMDLVHHMARLLPAYDLSKILILGPAPAPIYIINKKYRYRFIICAEKKLNIQQFIHIWLAKCVIPSSVIVKVDVDPQNFL